MVPPAPLTFSTIIGLAERRLHALADDARHDVGDAARRERHDHGDRPRRIGLRCAPATAAHMASANATDSLVIMFRPTASHPISLRLKRRTHPGGLMLAALMIGHHFSISAL